MYSHIIEEQHSYVGQNIGIVTNTYDTYGRGLPLTGGQLTPMVGGLPLRARGQLTPMVGRLPLRARGQLTPILEGLTLRGGQLTPMVGYQNWPV